MKNYLSHPYLDALSEVNDVSPYPVFLVDETLRFLYANEAAIVRYPTFCSENGIERLLGSQAKDVQQALQQNDTFRLGSQGQMPFQTLFFVRLYDSSGELAAISVWPIGQNAVLQERRFLRTETLYHAVLREILSPSADALSLLGKMRRGECTSSPAECLRQLERDACRSMTALQRVCDELGLLTRLSECDRSLISAFTFAKSFGDCYRIPVSLSDFSDCDARILADPNMLFKILADSASFLASLPQTGEKKIDVKILVCCEEAFVRIVLRRERVRSNISDPFSPTLNTEGPMNINLFSARELALQMGTELFCTLPDEKHHFAEVSVQMIRTFPGGDAFSFGDGWDDFFFHVPERFPSETALLMHLIVDK